MYRDVNYYTFPCHQIATLLALILAVCSYELLKLEKIGFEKCIKSLTCVNNRKEPGNKDQEM